MRDGGGRFVFEGDLSPPAQALAFKMIDSCGRVDPAP